jgi:hypothetical protein
MYMPFFSSTPKKPTDGPGIIRFQYCGYVQGPGGGPTTGMASKTINQTMNNADEATKYLRKQIATDSIKDGFGNPIGRSKMYQLSRYIGYTESKSRPGTFYHDFLLSSPEDSFCHSGGKRRSRKSRNTKRRKNRKSRKTRSSR